MKNNYRIKGVPQLAIPRSTTSQILKTFTPPHKVMINTQMAKETCPTSSSLKIFTIESVSK